MCCKIFQKTKQFLIAFSLGQANMSFASWGSNLSEPARIAFSFFIPDMKQMNRPLKSFLPTQKNWTVSGEYLMSRVSDNPYQETTSKNVNVILVNGNLRSCTSCRNLANVSRFPTTSFSSSTDGNILFKFYRSLSPSWLLWLFEERLNNICVGKTEMSRCDV